jgi:hypothetical protein
MSRWTNRVSRPTGRPVGPRELQEVRDAVRDLEDQSVRLPGRTGVIFQNVANVALIGTAVISGALASVHLWRALFPRHAAPRADASRQENQPDEGAGPGRTHPRRDRTQQHPARAR